MAASSAKSLSIDRHGYGKWHSATSYSHAGFSMAGFDAKRAFRKRRGARPSGICNMRDGPCYTAKLYFISNFFNKISSGRACSITLLSARARSSVVWHAL